MNELNNIQDVKRAVRNLIRTGIVTDVDHFEGLCRVQTGGMETTWLNWLNDRIGKPPAYQYLGVGETTRTLSGVLYPEITGGRLSLTAIELMADEGRAWPLIDGTGMIHGMYVIDKVTHAHTELFSDRLIGLTMTDNRGFEADQLDIELDDTDGLVELPPRGVKLTLWLGWQGSAPLNKGSFTVDEIEHRGAPDTLTIRGRSTDFRGS